MSVRALLVRSIVLATVGLAVGTTIGCGSAQRRNDSPASLRTAKVWFTDGEQFRTVQRKLPASGPKVVATLEALLRGPSKSERASEVETQIPSGVSVKRLTVTGTEADVELSPGFLENIPTAASQRTAAQKLTLSARLGQVIYTLKQFNHISSAKVRAAGVVLDATLADHAKPSTGPKPDIRPPGEPVSGTRLVQQLLADRGYLPKEAVDGRDGYRTKQAVMAFQAWEGLQRDGIAGSATETKLAEAGRPQPGETGPARRIEVYRDKGVALLISGGMTVRAIHVSTGKSSTPTPTGSYKVFRKELRSWSYPFSIWLPYASYFHQGIAFHEAHDVPAHPASAGCVRVGAPEAKGVYEFAKNDTVIVVR